MTQCLSEAEVMGYVRGAVNDQQRSAFDEHVSSCPGCKSRVEVARESSLDLAARPHQAATQVEVTAALPAGSRSGIDSHWTDGDVAAASQMSAESPVAAPKVSLDDFLVGLSQSGLLPAAEVANARDKSHKDPATSTVAGLIEWLVLEHKLTRYQANILARGGRGGLVLGNYVILDKLGQGGMGTVFKARHRRMNRLVALKVLPQSLSSVPEAIARFQREVEAAARLQHPNIAAAYDADEASGVHFLVMEYVEGPTLASYVKQRGPLPVAIAVRLAVQAARGLAAAHSQGIVHRDIKPSNIMINRQGIVKVLDMGLAQVRGPESLDLTSDVTQTGRVMGTVDYMAPEQARDAKNVDLRADIYSLGCTLFFLATGKTPAPGGSAAEKLLWHQTQPPVPLSEAGSPSSPSLDGLLARMMAKKADERPLSMHDVAEGLEKCLPELPTADSSMLLDGMDLVTEHGASTLYGSNYAQATMHNLGDTVVTQSGQKGSPALPAPGRPRTLLYGGLAAAAVVAAAIAAPFMFRGSPPPPAPPSESTLLVSVEGDPAEVFVNAQSRGTSRGGQPLELKVKPGSIFVQVKREGFEDYEQRVTVRAGEEETRVAAILKRLLPPPPSIHAPYEKTLAWVFRMQGQVMAVSGVGQKHPLSLQTPLPKEALEIQGIKLDGTGVRDVDLAALDEVPNLLDLSLADTKITDAGLASIGKLSRLQKLNLSKTGVTSAGLEHIVRLRSLEELNLERSAITNQGMSRLRAMTKLERLYLSDTALTDEGIVNLQAIPTLKQVTLHGTALSEPLHAALEKALPELKIAWDGADLERAAALKLLTKKATLAVVDRSGQRHEAISSVEGLPSGRVTVKEVNFSTATDIKDEDVKQLPNLPEIESISLAGTDITKDGLRPLESLATLRKLDLGTLNLPPAAVAQLRKALDKCNIVIRDPADVEVARLVLTAGGAVRVQTTERPMNLDEIRDATKLPANRFILRSIKLDGLPAANNALLDRLGELPGLESLSLANTAITDDGLQRIAACRSLKELTLSGAKITGEGLAALSPLTRLQHLYLAATGIGGAGVRHAGDFEALTHLSLQGVQLTDDDLAQLKRLTHLEWLDLSSTPLTDKANDHLTGLSSLKVLHVTQTALTDAGLEELRAALAPRCSVQGDPLDPERLAAKWLADRGATVTLETGKLVRGMDPPRDACRVLAIDAADVPLKSLELAPRLAVCQNLVSLNLRLKSLTQPTIAEADLVFLKTMPALRELRLAGQSLSDQTLALLAGHKNLEILDLSGNSRVTGSGLKHLRTAGGLKELWLANTRFDERYLPDIEPLTSLEALDLSSSSNVTSASAQTLIKFTGLRSLGLRGAKKLGDEAVEKLTALSDLERLDLDGTAVTDAGVGQLKALKKLRHIGLAATGVSTGIIPTLSEMKQLTSVNLSQTKIKDSDVQPLRMAIPGIYISAPSELPRDPNNPLGDAGGDAPMGGGIRIGRTP